MLKARKRQLLNSLRTGLTDCQCPRVGRSPFRSAEAHGEASDFPLAIPTLDIAGTTLEDSKRASLSPTVRYNPLVLKVGTSAIR